MPLDTRLSSLTEAVRYKINSLTTLVGSKVSSVSATSPIASTGGINPVLSIDPATTSLAGSLSASDKTKLDALGTASSKNIGTGGDTVPVLSGVNVWDARQTFSANPRFDGGITLRNTAKITFIDSMSGNSASLTFDGSAFLAATSILAPNLSGTNTGDQTIAVTAPLSSTGGSNPTISINAATTQSAGSMSAADKAKLDSIVKGVPLGVSGTMAGSEKLTVYPVVYAGSLTTTNSFAKSLVAATASTTLTIKRNATSIGTIVFVAGAITGTITINTPTVAYGDVVTIEAPATADAALADVYGVIRIA